MTEMQNTKLNFRSFKKCKNHSGYIALIGVLVVGAITVSITVSLLLLGVSSSRSTFALQQSSQARALANACVEEALYAMLGGSFAPGSLSLGRGGCDYTVTNLGGGSYSIDSEGYVDRVTRRVRVMVSQITPAIKLDSWQEI